MSQRIVSLSLHVVVSATIEEYWCPAVEVEWGDGEASLIAPDCRPFAEATDEDRWELEDMYRFTHPYRTKGEHVILVNISRNGKRIRQLKSRLEIR
ncbi:MAG: hypothetical protein IT406_01275 [Candidatus Yanofskybacteria bacterium]|nr:hypothetical protein [Candidatus Yanofskybacteria bacterium]